MEIDSDQFYGWPMGVVFEASSDNAAWVAVPQTETGGYPITPHWYTFDAPMTYRYWRVTMSEDNGPGLHGYGNQGFIEWKVLGCT
jgi:hypothetical protein